MIVLLQPFVVVAAAAVVVVVVGACRKDASVWCGGALRTRQRVTPQIPGASLRRRYSQTLESDPKVRKNKKSSHSAALSRSCGGCAIAIAVDVDVDVVVVGRVFFL
uniref:Secreted protein n=1 Tax=Ananas comosus var. bracteatus TaxID=296719 RepID=A0A6V7QJC8_ANACO|nr:unnamed protein product [Ananas comosus var. bracteatus]